MFDFSKRRKLLKAISSISICATQPFASVVFSAESRFSRTKAQWLELISAAQYDVLFQHATERPFSSPLDKEERPGVYLCAACMQPLFMSKSKYNSGTGWPSFFDVLPNAIGTQRDFRLLLPRTEYHCSNCGGHQGHVFDDGPKPTGKRYCNNGLALAFYLEGTQLPLVRKS